MLELKLRLGMSRNSIVEVTPAELIFRGWIVTYLIGERGAGPSAGYVSSGFFAGE